MRGIVCKSISSTFITLVKDFRPISLITSVHKIRTNVLANKFGTIIGNTISQSAFIEGRQILDSPLIADELVDDVKTAKGNGLVLKLDFEKVYDGVCWDIFG